MRYENLLSRALRITWRRPWLWLLALLAGESGGAGGSGSSASSFQQPNAPNTANGSSIAAPDLGWVPVWLTAHAALLLGIAAALLVVGVLLFLLSCVAEGALIRAAAKLDQGERVTLGQAWSEGRSSFWRVLGFKVVAFLLVFIPFLLLLGPPLLGLAGGPGGFLKGLLLDLPLAIAYIFWAVFVSWLSVLAVRACVLDGAGPIACFGAGWRLLKERFPRVALTGVLLLAVGIGVGIVFQLVYGILSVPFASTVLGEAARSNWLAIWPTLLAWFALLLPVSLLLSSAIGAYYATVWTLAYRRFGVEGELPEPPPLAA